MSKLWLAVSELLNFVLSSPGISPIFPFEVILTSRTRVFAITYALLFILVQSLLISCLKPTSNWRYLHSSSYCRLCSYEHCYGNHLSPCDGMYFFSLPSASSCHISRMAQSLLDIFVRLVLHQLSDGHSTHRYRCPAYWRNRILHGIPYPQLYSSQRVPACCFRYSRFLRCFLQVDPGPRS